MFRYFEWLIPALPLLGALLNSLSGTRLTRRTRSWVAGGALIGSLLAVLPVLAGQIIQPGLVGGPGRLPWLTMWTGSRFLSLSLSMVIDPMATVLALTILVCGWVIWIDVNRAFPEDGAHRRALILLGSAIAALLGLVLAGNLVLMLICWSLAGWSLYALSGEHPDAGPDRSPVRFLLADVSLLLAVGIVIRLTRPALPPAASTAPGAAAAGVLLLVAAAARSTQIPLNTTGPSALLGGRRVLSAIPAFYLLARMDPLLRPVPLLPPLMMGAGAAAALGLAAAALYRPHDNRGPALLALAQGGLLLSGLGVGAHTAAVSFLPAYALIHLSIQPTGSEASPRGGWARLVALAALAGLPLLPGLTWHAQLFQAALTVHWAVLAMLALAVFVLAAAAGRAARRTPAAPAPVHLRAPAVSGAIAAALILLGLAGMLSPPALARFLAPASGARQPSWPLVILALLAGGLGAAAGYAGGRWLDRIPASGPRYRLHLPPAAEDPLLRAAGRLAGSVEPWLGRWTFDLLARLWSGRAGAGETDRPIDSDQEEAA